MLSLNVLGQKIVRWLFSSFRALAFIFNLRPNGLQITMLLTFEISIEEQAHVIDVDCIQLLLDDVLLSYRSHNDDVIIIVKLCLEVRTKSDL